MATGPGKFDKPKDRAVITGKDARDFRAMSDKERKNGTYNDNVIARSRDEFVDRSIILEDN